MNKPHVTTSPPLAHVYNNVLEMIGNTPIVECQKLDTGPCQLFFKMESLNPGNSIKDRIAVSMIDAAEAAGHLEIGGHLIEATAGNTGIALALVAQQKGYQVTVVVPDKMSAGKISHLRAMGAQVVIARSDVEKGHPDYYQDVAARIARETPNSFYINQFANPANIEAHYETTGPEIWNQLDHQVDAFVAGVGSGGTVSGAGRFLKECNPELEVILADPEGSILAPLVNDGKEISPGSWLVEGIGEDFVPDILDLSLVDKAYSITDKEAFFTARDLLHKEGILAGSSVGTLLAAALQYCREQTEPKRVVTLICDNGAKYLDKMFNDLWMVDQGFIERTQHGNLRDLIARRHLHGEDHTLRDHMPLTQAIKMMRLYDISQMSVLDQDNKVIGILDESDVLMALMNSPDMNKRPVSDFMTSRLQTVSPDASINDLMPIFRADRVAIVRDDSQYYGLITRIDLINYLRAKMP